MVVTCLLELLGCDDSKQSADMIEMDLARRIVEKDQATGRKKFEVYYDDVKYERLTKGQWREMRTLDSKN
jgi:hypothetical protein